MFLLLTNKHLYPYWREMDCDRFYADNVPETLKKCIWIDLKSIHLIQKSSLTIHLIHAKSI